MKILLTGATGFLGSHIAEALLANGVNLMITKRSMSSLNNCVSFIDHVQVINSDGYRKLALLALILLFIQPGRESCLAIETIGRSNCLTLTL